MKDINSSNLGQRLDTGRGKDEIEQLAITFNGLLSELELAFKSQDEFVSNASHELRTPLSIMIAESDYVSGRQLTSEEYKDHISVLVKDLRKMNQLINGMLELAHLNRNNKIDLSRVRIDEPVLNAIQTVKAKYPERKIILKIGFPPNEENLLIEGNSELLEIAFRNLIDNAVKFSEKDIEVVVSVMEESIHASVTDRGIGIPAGESMKISKPFERASNARFVGGYGIGLSIVRKIAGLHKSDIVFHSKENEGTSVELIFPKAGCSLQTS